jgi:hypothetical protein
VVDLARKVIAYYVEPDASAYDRSALHGTSVAGCVLGDNYASRSTATDPGRDRGDGNAPNARLVMLDGADGHYMTGTVGDLTPIFLQAYRAGARIENHSFGNPDVMRYGPMAADVDRFAWRHEDMLFIQSAGNSGRQPGDGTVIDPATAKNGLAVGATNHGGAGARDLASFSSRGPTLDGRLKPDLVAPGMGVVTAAGDGDPGSDRCITGNGWGTSFSAPTVAGWAALVRQYLRDGFLPSGSRDPVDATLPSSALLRAMLIASSRDIEGFDPLALGPVDPPPSFNQGWGRPLLDDVLYFAGDARRTLALDLANRRGLAAGAIATFDLDLAPSAEPLEVVLAWTDPPAVPFAPRTLVNDLDLAVYAPSGAEYRGNAWAGGESIPDTGGDTVNPVEAVRIAAPSPGRYRILVFATRVGGAPGVTGSDRQGFALVATHGGCPGGSPPAPLLDGIQAESGAIDLTWQAVPGAFGYVVYRADAGAGAGPADFAQLTPVPIAGTTYSDVAIVCGTEYSYRVRVWNGCALGPASLALQATAGAGTGCPIAPDFSGIGVARPAGPCGMVHLEWEPATSSCPCSAGVVYNLWAAPSPVFDPDTTAPLVTCLDRISIDLLAPSSGLLHYLVRAEDRVGPGSGACAGGASDENLRRLATVSTSPTRRVRLREGFEAGRSLWSRESLYGANAWAIATDPLASSPAHALTGTPVESASDSVATLLQPILASADTLVAFRHTFELEGRYDGGVIEISGDGGQTWADAGGRLVADRYTDWMTTGAANATLRPGFTGGSLGPMREGLLWLGDLAGSLVRLRFRALSDATGRRERWAIDDLQVFDRDCQVPAGSLVPAFTHGGPVCDGDEVAFDASATYGGSPPYRFAWDFGDATVFPDAPASMRHTYPSSGSYVATLQVTDRIGVTRQLVELVVVVAEVMPPALANVLRLTRSGAGVALSWSEPGGPWAGTEVVAGAAFDGSDAAPVTRVPWDGPREVTLPAASGQRRFAVRLLSSCHALAGP